ncbi:MAG: M56 family metallopeptidase [Lachnospiraceae bacterium]|nr:M56 family metallopeptidase [Lachnospiraceae bacterium]
MSAKWRKAIWLMLIIQLYLFHGFLILNMWRMDYLAGKVVNHFSLPYVLYDNWKYLTIAGWIFIAIVLLFWQVLGYFRFRNACYRDMRIVKNVRVREGLTAAKANTGYHKELGVYQSRRIKSPLVLGFYHPVMLVPEKLVSTEAVDHAPLELIFAHECRHMKAKDNWYKFLVMVSRCFLWYQPFIYLIKPVVFRNLEVACDESIVKGKTREDRIAYGQLLIDYLRLYSENRQTAWTTYFYNSKTVMKARIRAVTKEERRMDWLAVIAILVLLCETIFIGSLVMNQLQERVELETEENIVNIYEGYELPEAFTEQALKDMLRVEQRAEELGGTVETPEKEWLSYEELPLTAEGPWQIRSQWDRGNDTLDKMITRYLYALEDQEQGSLYDPEESGSVAEIELSYFRKLADDGTDSVYYVIGGDYLWDDEPVPLVEQGAGMETMKDGSRYVNYCLAVHVRKVADYVYELMGLANGNEALNAFRETYPQQDYNDVAEIDMGVSAVEETLADYRIVENQLEATIDGSTWESVPLSLEMLFDRGDQMDGVLSSVQEKSFQVNDTKQIFAYGGSNITSAAVVYRNADGTWENHTVTTKYQSVRRFFVSFPEDAEHGFLILTNDRTMYQEASILFTTEDGGRTWIEKGDAGPDLQTMSHSLTTGASFITNEIGFLSIRSSSGEPPELWRTDNGGITWTLLEIQDVPEYYSMAYPPELQNGQLILYLGMEEYSEMGGEKAVYLSDDMGETWTYDGIRLRK